MERVSRVEAVPRIVSAVRRLKAARRNIAKPVVIAVVGASASGKGHLIQELVGRLGAADATVLPLDNYYIGREAMRRKKVPHFDHPDSVELTLAARHLESMRVGKTLTVPCYDFPSGERVGYETCEARPFVLVDGLFGLRPEIQPLVDYAVYIDAGVQCMLLRRLFRDAGPAGRTKQSAREVLEMYFTIVLPSMRAFIAPTQAHADLIVESRYDGRVESARAGGLQYQCKARGYVDDDAILQLVGGQRLGAAVRQRDLFLKPKKGARSELLRLRTENGACFLSYKGPLLTRDPEIGARHVSALIEIDPASVSWFREDYRTVATIEKVRSTFHAGSVMINRDSFSDGLGNFVEARALGPASGGATREALRALGLPGPYLAESYYSLWQKRQKQIAAAAAAS